MQSGLTIGSTVEAIAEIPLKAGFESVLGSQNFSGSHRVNGCLSFFYLTNVWIPIMLHFSLN